MAWRPVKKGEYIWGIVDDLLRKAKAHFRINTVHADAEFAGAGVSEDDSRTSASISMRPHVIEQCLGAGGS